MFIYRSSGYTKETSSNAESLRVSTKTLSSGARRGGRLGIGGGGPEGGGGDPSSSTSTPAVSSATTHLISVISSGGGNGLLGVEANRLDLGELLLVASTLAVLRLSSAGLRFAPMVSLRAWTSKRRPLMAP